MLEDMELIYPLIWTVLKLLTKFKDGYLNLVLMY